MPRESSIPEFGIKREDEERRDGGCGIVFDPKTQQFAVYKSKELGRLGFFAGGVEEGEDIQEGVLREVREESGLHNFKYTEKIAEALTHYYHTTKKLNRAAHATCFLVILENTDLKPTKLEEHEKFSLTWVTAKEIMDNLVLHNTNHDRDHWIYFFDIALTRLRALNLLTS